MTIRNQATRISLFSLRAPQMRAFHMTWFAFFLAFFGWFGVAPLMAVVREDLSLTKTQVGNTIIASVMITVVVRVLIGPLCERFGPRRVYAWLLILGSVPVMCVGLAQSYVSFLLFRLAIGAIGAAFVITQFHTSVMFAPNIVGTANATTAGWGNLGGGVTQILMPLMLAALVGLGVDRFLGWRLAMAIPGAALFLTGIAYALLTRDAPDGDFKELRARGELPAASRLAGGSLAAAVQDVRVWALFIIYAACFGVELTINNVAALYYHDRFALDIKAAGLIAGSFGLMNLFARTLGGALSDRLARRGGLRGRVAFLGSVLFLEGIALMLFSRMDLLPRAVVAMIVFSLFVQMAEGATFGVVPFVNRKALGAVAGLVGAGGNAGAVLAGFLFRSEALSAQQALMILGVAVTVASSCALVVRFSPAAEAEQRQAIRESMTRAATVAG
ncbi:MFS transporter [Candidatus Poribacteria bacterium]|nr:MFS transporter [Candidatus Poribacteria bacterium]